MSDEIKPREWFIGWPDGENLEEVHDANSGGVHVIEKSAYDALRAELDKANRCAAGSTDLLAMANIELARVRDVCEDLNRQNNITFEQSCKNLAERDQALEREKILREALDWYGNRAKWEWNESDRINYSYDDQGRKARQALEAVEKLK